ncbi:hypothetical protein [Brevibacillus laterosporus]|uniref:hypothetical protein n=1 Tax=Brevibacillus laterosporus TaxID=1465 RepID=UPI00197BFA92|nr:hypothetical protein [Brevibacillus laterosporus]WNX29736.1 hypothetical protein RWW94_16045 [Brevibacillus laterosporus]
MPQRSPEALIRQATTTRKGRSKPANLREQVDPQTMKLWPTPVKSDFKRRGPNSKQQGLPEVVKMWPTPNASDHRDRGNLSNPCIQNRMEKGKQLELSMVVSDQSGQLNPDWVEALMGFPIGWTNLEVDEPGEHWIVDPRWPAAMGQEQYDWEPPRVATGVKNRVERLKACGNAVSPAQVFPLLEGIKAVHDAISLDKHDQHFQTPNERHDTASQADQETQTGSYRCLG